MKELEENVIGKNFMITYDFSDNDFGGHIEYAIETWVDSNSEDMIKIPIGKT